MTTAGRSSAGRYRYTAADSTGRLERGRLDARSAAEAEAQLADRGLQLVSIRSSWRFEWHRRVSRQDLAVFFKGVASLSAVGVPVERAMEASEALVPPRLQGVVSRVRRLVREGASVAEALESEPTVFPRLVVGMVRSGEQGSRLTEALEQVASQLEEEARLRASVRSAMAYPMLLALVGVVSVLIMGLVVVPRFAAVLEGFGADLPWSTELLLAASASLRRYGVVVVGVGIVAAGVAAHLAKRPVVRLRLHAALLRGPVVGGIRHGFSSARLCQALGSMLAGGMPILWALDAARDAIGDEEISRRVEAARDAVSRGAPLTPSLRQERAVTPLALQLIGVGEASGELATLMTRAGEISGERAQRSLRALVSLLEPLLVITLGLVVALIAAALLQAVYSVRPA